MKKSGGSSPTRFVLAAIALLLIAASLFLIRRSIVRGGGGGADEEPVSTPRDRRAREPAQTPKVPVAGPSPRAVASVEESPDAPGKDAPEKGRDRDPRTLWQKRLARAQFTLESYEQATRYPPESRPASEHPDRIQIGAPVSTKLPLSRKDGKLTDAKVTLTQDSVNVTGNESVRFWLTCENTDGPKPCVVGQGTVREAPHTKEAGKYPPVPIAFNDDGTNGDDEASDGTFTARLTPSRERFAGWHGPLLVEVPVRVGSEDGTSSWEVLYTPEVPAAFTGTVREAVEEGSLALYIGILVKKPGRYLLNARVDGADGKPFGYLQFNGSLEVAARELRMVLFGKLLRDESPTMPLHVRDLDGYRFLPGQDPDRELLKALKGIVYTTKTYDLKIFSETAWSSEEKDRHVKEFTKDVQEAQGKVEQEASGTPPPP